ncbi:restriction endonuclease subunit S [Lactiplantibacillus plantarum]|uniref:restriction endonuclease subunit S n=1 Tax=Lactiplantibacillus plantarum TaxID=1590 RepID=UPI00273820EA|nr:restriction endonuclease subunit S [Lactiplantibacillus plantarum]
MKDNQAKYPQLRFKGFTDPWEQRSFKTLYKKVIEKNDLSFESDRIISVANMYYKPNDSKSDEKYMETYNIFRLGDIAFEGNKSKNFAYGRFVENTIGDGIVSHVFDVFRPISEYDLNYWKYFIHYEDIMGQKLRMSTTKATMMNNLVSKDFLKQSVLVPNLDEQQKIGSFFKQLDDTIALHQRKLAKLKELKQGYLQKMFPKNGAKVPELRFAGFADAWEQRKLGDYYEFKNGLNKGKEAFGSGSPIVNFVDVFHNRRLTPNMLSGRVNLTDKEILNFEVQDGDLFFTRTSETIDEIGFPSVMDGSPKATTFSGFVLRGRAISMDPLITSFKAHVFFTDAFRVEMKKKSSMTTRALTSGSALKKMFFNFPAQQDEQQKIGTFFQQLDDLITLHQRKLEKLQELKKGYLQKMFC